VPPRDWFFRIADILHAIAVVQRYTSGMKFEEFVADRKTVDAVIKNFIVIGEAAYHIPEEICQANLEIPWSDMRSMRNFVVHEYFGVTDKILWDTIQVDLPPVVPLLTVLLSKYKQETEQGNSE
jgi:uncharacterized protein with HEPN domain